MYTFGPDLELLSDRVRSRWSAGGGGRARGQELGHQPGAGERQDVEERENHKGEQGDYERSCQFVSGTVIIYYVQRTGFEDHQKKASRKYCTF